MSSVTFKVVLALIAALVNFILSVLIPCALKGNTDPWVVQFRKMFDEHRKMLITSSLLVGLIVYMALEAGDAFKHEIKGLIGVDNLGDLQRVPTLSVNPDFNLRAMQDMHEMMPEYRVMSRFNVRS
jgi:hypothetical protein